MMSVLSCVIFEVLLPPAIPLRRPNWTDICLSHISTFVSLDFVKTRPLSDTHFRLTNPHPLLEKWKEH